MGSTTLRLILAGMPRPAAPLAPPAPSRAPEPPPEPPPPPAGTYGSVERSAASLDVRAILAERRAPEEPLAPESAARRSSVPAAGDGALARRRAAELGKALHEIRSLTDQIVREGDFEILLERVASAFLDIFEADRGVCVLFEEDGRNPLLTVERQRSGSEEGAGISRKVIDRVLEARTVIRVNAVTPDGAEGVGFASPLLSETRPLGVLYFERAQASLGTIAADELHFIGIISNCVALAIRSLL
jgi:transcriptional regulator with GAF, ATPase, and Fis domain